MSTKGRIDRAFKRLGLDRCPCGAEPSRTIVVMPGDQAPMIDHCLGCGRASALVIEIVYVDEPPPGWFVAEHPGIDTEAMQQRWQEYLDEHERQYLSRHAGPLAP